MIKKLTLYTVFSLISLLAIASCSCVNHNTSLPAKSGHVDVDGASDRVSDANRLSIEAMQKLRFAQEELEKSRQEAEDAKSLVEQMKKNKSPYADMVASLRNKYESLVHSLTEQLTQTGMLLDEQIDKLKDARIELNKARVASAASEQEKKALRRHIETVDQKLNEAEKEVNKLQEWKDKNMFYKKFFWWTLATVVILGGAWIYFTGATGGLARFLRR